MKVLVACECSGVVRDAFAKRGHNAWSCDLKPSEVGGKHLQCNVLDILPNGWDLMIAHPPCTFLASSGMHRTVRGLRPAEETDKSVAFVVNLWNAPINKICLENPVGVLSTRFRPPDQYIDPTQFGHGHTKKTGLWLKNLSLLVPPPFLELPVFEKADYEHLTHAHTISNTPNRAAQRAVTFRNIAYAMASQWG